jgi:thioredoxin 1
MTPQELEQTIQDNKVVVVDFYADWCNPCKMLTPVLETTCRNSGVKLIKLNIEDQSNIDIARQFNVRSIPYVVRFENGTYSNTMVGVADQIVVENFVKGQKP